MTDKVLQKCSVVLEPYTPKMKECYVSLQQCAIISLNEKAQRNGMHTAIATPKPALPLEPMCTPNVEPALATELRRAITEKNILTTKTKSKFISALNELEVANAESSRRQKKEKAMREVIDSEIAYLKQLEIIIKYFKEPLMDRFILSEEEIEKIFSKVTMLHNVNKELLDRMSENPISIAQAFKKVAPYLKIYSTYAYEYKMISEFLQVLQDKNDDFAKFLECQESRPEVKMKLFSLLITPIQRIPRYCLLLKQILLYTSEIEADYDILKESLQLVEESARHINSLVEERENSERLLKIQNSLLNHNPQIIKPGRKLIKEGKVLKMMENGGNIMYLVAMTDILMFCKIKKENMNLKNALKCSSILPLSKCQFTQNATLRRIHISCENEINVDIYIETTKEFYQWLDVLKESRKNIVCNRYTLRKESSARRPANKENLSNYNEVGVSPGIPQKKRRTPVPSAVITNTVREKVENKRKNPQYITLAKRRCIRDTHQEKTPDKVNDSLYPLRHHYLPESGEQYEITDHNSNENAVAQNQNTSSTDDVFVFGQPNNPERGFNFKIINFFNYLGHSLRRLFRIK